MKLKLLRLCLLCPLFIWCALPDRLTAWIVSQYLIAHAKKVRA